MSKNFCKYCGDHVLKDVIALNKKLLGRNINEVFCIECLADYLCCTTDDLIIKIEDFKEQGCTLFK